MAGKGGYQPPANPAPASGPGSLSRRTDGQVQAVPSGGDYGARQALLAQERGAKLSATPNPNIPGYSPPSGGLSLDQSQAGAAQAPMVMPDFGRPSERPNEPITTGVDIGPGAGQDVLPQQHQAQLVVPG